jgi:hypothetical protein
MNSGYPFITICALALTLASARAPWVVAQAQDGPTVDVVDRQEIYEAMLLERRKGYALTTTTNSARFSAYVFLQLARWARARDPEGLPLLIDHERYFQAYLRVTGLTPLQAPMFIRMPHQYGQDQLIEYRPGRVIETVEQGPQPEIAVSVKSWWPDAPAAPSEYSYQDTLSRPNLKIVNEQMITYRLLDYGDLILFDDIHGVEGRPTSGFYGLLFKIIGTARVVESRIALSQDGLQVVFGEARKGVLSRTAIATVNPDGTVREEIVPARPDLQKLEATLKQPLKITYKPFAL